MVYNWIDAKAYKMDCFLFFDRWILDFIFQNIEDSDYVGDMAKALYNYPYVKEFIRKKAPEVSGFMDAIDRVDCTKYSLAELREAETKILQMHETFVVYAFSRIMIGSTISATGPGILTFGHEKKPFWMSSGTDVRIAAAKGLRKFMPANVRLLGVHAELHQTRNHQCQSLDGFCDLPSRQYFDVVTASCGRLS